MNNIINDKGLISGLYSAQETTTRKECLQISIKIGDKKLLSSIPLRNGDFDLQYLKACSKIVDTFGGNLIELVETKQNFMKKYNLEYVEIKIKAVYQA